MTVIETDKKTRMIAALLAKANDPAATDAERESYNDKATALMIRYGVDAALLAARDSHAPKESITQHHVEYTGTYAPELVLLGHRVGDALGLRTYQVVSSGRRTSTRKLYLVGFQSDVDFARLILGSLQIQLTVAADRHMRSYNLTHSAASAGDKYKRRRAFIVGFAQRVAERLVVTRRATVQEAEAQSGPGTDLVLVDRQRQVDEWLQDAVGPLRTTKGRRRYGVGGAEAGRAAGDRADVGQGGVSNTSGRKALS